MKQRLPLMIIVAGLILSGSSAVASATTIRPSTQSQYHYCVARAFRIGSTRQPTATCYRTFAASISAATDGKVRLPATAKPGSVTPDEINAVDGAPATSIIVGIDYMDANLTGYSLAVTAPSKCGTTSTTYSMGVMPNGWNDVVSSLITSSGCASTLYANGGFVTPAHTVGKNATVDYLTGFNDVTSSQKWA